MSLVSILALWCGSAHGATYTVTNTLNDGAGSLEQAILDANANKGHDTIAFAIPGAGPHTIALTNALPTITDPVLIDGLTQKGAACGQRGSGHTLMVMVDGQGVFDTWGGIYFRDGADGSTVRGLSVGGFRRAVRSDDASDVTVQCNYLGMQPDGLTPIDDSLVGVIAAGYRSHSVDRLTVGTDGDGVDDDLEWNLISGNQNDGIYLYTQRGLTQGQALIAGNLIGSDATGTVPVGNHRGIYVANSYANSRIGTSSDGVSDQHEGNLFSGNRRSGVEVGQSYGSNRMRISGNLFGTTLDGTARLDTSRTPIGVYVVGDHDQMQIGGTAATDLNRFVGQSNSIRIQGVRRTESGRTDFDDPTGFYGGAVPTNTVIQGNVFGLTSDGTVSASMQALYVVLAAGVRFLDNQVVGDGTTGWQAIRADGAELDIDGNLFQDLPRQALDMRAFYGNSEVDLELDESDDVLAIARITGNTFRRISLKNNRSSSSAILAYDTPLDAFDNDQGAAIVSGNTWDDMGNVRALRQFHRGGFEYVLDGSPAVPYGSPLVQQVGSDVHRSSFRPSGVYAADADMHDAVLIWHRRATNYELATQWPLMPVYSRDIDGTLDTVTYQTRCGDQFSFDGDGATHPSDTAGWPDGIAYPVAHDSFLSGLKDTVDRYQVFEFGSDCETCGNGVVGPAEACDDGNTDDGDGCSATCTVEADQVCVNADVPRTGVDPSTGELLTVKDLDLVWERSSDGVTYESAGLYDVNVCRVISWPPNDTMEPSLVIAPTVDSCEPRLPNGSEWWVRGSFEATPADLGVEWLQLYAQADDKVQTVRVNGAEVTLDENRASTHSFGIVSIPTETMVVGSNVLEFQVRSSKGASGFNLASTLSTCGLDTDGDGVGDLGDPDSDNDGIADEIEGTTDGDGDGIPNHLDLDANGDGVLDVLEVGLTDDDGDGRVDGPDTDRDGVADAVDLDPADPAEQTVTTSLIDTDKDGLIDTAEIARGTDPKNPDSDADLLSDGDEVHLYGSDPLMLDTDLDGLLDGAEIYGFDATPGTADDTDPADADSDDDGLSDGEELLGPDGWPFTDDETDPNDDDTDDDGLGDGLELGISSGIPDEGVTLFGTPIFGTDLGVADLDTDDTTLTDPNDDDTDDDGLLDGEEDADANGYVDARETDPNVVDTDGDGIDDGADNCGAVPNGATPMHLDTADAGLIRQWMLLGIIDYADDGGRCYAEDVKTDHDLMPEFGDVDRELGSWFQVWQPRDYTPIVDFVEWYGVVTSADTYAATWLYSPDTRAAELSMGADDGFRVWLDDMLVGEHIGCQTVRADRYRYPVTLSKGWNRVLVRVHQRSGQWGMAMRVYESDGSTPMTDLETSFAPMSWSDDQSDGDADGVGDACDTTP